MLSKLKKIFLYGVILYTILGFILLPLILKPQLTSIVQKQTNALLHIDALSFNPFTCKIALDGVLLQDLKKNTLVSCNSLSLNLEPSSLLYGALHIKDFTLSKPVLHLVYNKNKTLNIFNIVKQNKDAVKEKKSEGRLPRIIIDSVKLEDGTLEYKDFTKKDVFEFSFNDLGFKLHNIDTNDLNSSKGNLRLYTTLGDGGFVDLKSKIVGFKPFIVTGSLDFQASKLYTEWKYIKDKLKLEVADGKISLNAEYHLNAGELNATKVAVKSVLLENLRIKPKDKHHDILKLKSLGIQNIDIQPFKQDVVVEKVALKGLKAEIKRQENKKIDWLEYLAIDSNTTDLKDTNETNSSNKWNVKVQNAALEKIALNFQDAAIMPHVTTAVNDFNVYAYNITLAGEEPLSYKMNAVVNDRLACKSIGKLTLKGLDFDAQSSCNGFDIVHYRPYIDAIANENLKLYNVALQSAVAGFQLSSHITEHDDKMIATLDANLSLDDFNLLKHHTKSSLVNFKNLHVEGVHVDTSKNSTFIENAVLKNLHLNVQRYKNGTLNVENLVKAKATKASKEEKTTSKRALSFMLKHFALKSARVNFSDSAIHKQTTTQLDKINIDLYDVDMQKKSWLQYKASLRVNKKGSVVARGKLRHTPLKQEGHFSIQKISLKEFSPYIQESTYAKIADGFVSLKGVSDYEASSHKPDLKIKSSFDLNSLFINDSRSNALLLSLNKVHSDTFTFSLSPNELSVNALTVNSFYVNAKIDENKTLNFAQLMKPVEEKPKVVEKNTTKPFPVNILQVNVNSGSASFADYSIPIKFYTEIHDLNGVVYALSSNSGEVSYINITGEVDKYGSTHLKGSIDGTNPKDFTDLDFNFKNLDLHSFSGYSASFAGHEIDSGKLYLDLGYNILHSQLQGTNSIMMKKVTLGKEVEDENVTVLPLGFVLGLLEDSDGVVDIDMPVEGNVDEPDFKYGRLVLQTIGNLITEAVTSPFRFLASAMGINAENLEYISFEPGKAIILPPEREKLDQVAKMLLKKPKIYLNLSGSYDVVADKRALQLQKLIKKVVQKNVTPQTQEHESLISSELLEDIYKDMRDDDKITQLQEDLAREYKGKEYKRAYQKELLGLCISIQAVTKDALETLAHNRARAISTYLVNERSIQKSRVLQNRIVAVDISGENYINTNMEVKVK